MTDSILDECALDTAVATLLSRLAANDARYAFPASMPLVEQLQRAGDLLLDESATPFSERRFRAMVEHAAEAFALLNPDGTFRYVTPAAARINGYPLDEFPGQNAFDIIHPDDMPQVMAAFTRLLREPDSPQCVQYRLQHRDGSWRWAEAIGSNLLAEPTVQAIVINYRDITARKEAEDALRRAHDELEERVLQRTAELTTVNAALRKAEAIAHLGHWEWDVGTRQMRLSDEAFHILGIPPQTMTITSFLLMVHPDDRELLTYAKGDYSEHLQTKKIEYRIHRPDGTVRVLRDSGEVDYDETGAPMRVFGTIQDITENKQAEMALRESEARYRSLAETAQDFIFIIDTDDRVRYVNSYAAAKVGYRAEDIIGKTRHALFPPEIAQAQQHSLARVMATCEPMQMEGMLPFPTGNGWIHTSLVPLKNAEGVVTGVLGISRDITERKRMEQALRESDATLRAIMDASAEVIFLIDRQGALLALNERFAANFHRAPAELIGAQAFDLVPPDIAATRRAFLEQAFATGESLVHEDCRDGRVFENRVYPLRDATGQVDRLAIFASDITARKQAEIALYESEERFRTVADYTYDWEYWLGLNGRYLYVSPSCERITGYGREEFFADPDLLRRITHPDDRAMMHQHLTEGLSRQEFCMFDFRIIDASGAERWISHACRPVYDADGQLFGVRASNRDITDRKLIEEALRESEERYRRLFEDSPIPLLEMDCTGIDEALGRLAADGVTDLPTHLAQHPDDVIALVASMRMLAANNAAQRFMTPVTSEGITSASLTSSFTPDTYEVFVKGLLAFIAGDTTFEHETTYRLPDGETRAVIIRCFLLPGDARMPEKMLIAILDITERKQAEERLEQLLEQANRWAAQLDTTFSAIADGVVIYGAQGEIVRMNAAAQQILDIPPDYMNHPFAERMNYMLARDGNTFNLDDLPSARALRGETVRGYVLEMPRGAGHSIWLSISAAPMYGPDGAQIGAVTTFADITARREQQQRQEEFLHLVSHDLRTPLTVIQGHAEALKTAGLPGNQAVSTDAILRSAQRMNVMIQDLVDLARIEGHYLSLYREPLMLQTYLPDLLAHLSGTLGVNRVTVDVAECIPPVSVDANRLERILVNLLSNALKYSPEESAVHLRVTAGDAMVDIAVIDTGIGIPPQALPRLFERFYRAPNGRKADGLGLGLYITKLLVEAHGGAIRVESTVGEGSTFTVSLPRVDADEQDDKQHGK